MDLNNIKKLNNIKNNILIRQILINIFILAYSTSVFGQNITDSLAKDSAQNIKTTKYTAKDTVKNKQNQENIFPGNDTLTPTIKKKNPFRAGLYSAILPGLGQAYNGNYWKIPVIYSIFAGMYFLAEDNGYKYKIFKDAYKNFDTQKPAWLGTYWRKEDVKRYKDNYKRSRDLDIIIMVAIYLANIMDASVDAHLMDYDISDDLSLHIQPAYGLCSIFEKNNKNSGFGIKFVLSF